VTSPVVTSPVVNSASSIRNDLVSGPALFTILSYVFGAVGAFWHFNTHETADAQAAIQMISIILPVVATVAFTAWASLRHKTAQQRLSALETGFLSLLSGKDSATVSSLTTAAVSFVSTIEGTAPLSVPATVAAPSLVHRLAQLPGSKDFFDQDNNYVGPVPLPAEQPKVMVSPVPAVALKTLPPPDVADVVHFPSDETPPATAAPSVPSEAPVVSVEAPAALLAVVIPAGIDKTVWDRLTADLQAEVVAQLSL